MDPVVLCVCMSVCARAQQCFPYDFFPAAVLRCVCKVHYVDVRVHGADVRVHGADVRVHGADVRVQGADVRVQGADVRVQGAKRY